jgi:prepilin-type N-terminal cleavage/methylation domain-containing protein
VSPRAARSRRQGFTLLELLVVVLFTSIVLVFAANFTIELSRASEAALSEGVDVRRATTVLDRVTRDLEAAVLVKKPDELDPLQFPWLFLAEGRTRDGADRLRFQARNHRPRPGGGPESDLVEIAYWLVPAEEGDGFDLMRWSSARPPVAPLDRNFPRLDDPGVEKLASRVAAFGVLLQDADGAWQSAWDSASPAQSSELPIAARVLLALLPEDAEAEDGQLAQPLEPFERPVVFALDPLDLEKALGGEEEDGEDEEGEEGACLTVAECVARNQAAVDQYLGQNPELGPILQSIAAQCWRDNASNVPFQVANCEE